MSLNKIFIIFNIFRQNTMNKNNYKNNYKNIKKCKSKNWTASPLQPAKNSTFNDVQFVKMCHRAKIQNALSQNNRWYHRRYQNNSS